MHPKKHLQKFKLQGFFHSYFFSQPPAQHEVYILARQSWHYQDHFSLVMQKLSPLQQLLYPIMKKILFKTSFLCDQNVINQLWLRHSLSRSSQHFKRIQKPRTSSLYGQQSIKKGYSNNTCSIWKSEAIQKLVLSSVLQLVIKNVNEVSCSKKYVEETPSLRL